MINYITTDITIYWAGGFEDEQGEINAMFEYDDMLYQLVGAGLTEEEMIEFIKELS